MWRLAPILLVAAALAGCGQAGGGVAGSTNLTELMSGDAYPLTLQMSDLDGEWRRFSLHGGGAELMQMYSAMLGGSGGVYYTKGDVVRSRGESYLVAYCRRAEAADFSSMMERGPMGAGPDELTPETALGLCLLNIGSMGSLVDIRQFSLEEELGGEAARPFEMPGADSLSNLKNLALALQMFLADNNDVMPDITDTQGAMEVLRYYVRDEDSFTNPETGELYVLNPSLATVRLADVADPVNIAVFYESSPDEDGMRAAAFLDGHAALLSESQWEEVKEASGIE
jgi:hypothetical protein